MKVGWVDTLMCVCHGEQVPLLQHRHAEAGVEAIMHYRVLACTLHAQHTNGLKLTNISKAVSLALECRVGRGNPRLSPSSS